MPPANDNGEVAPATFPYISIGTASDSAENYDCIYGHDIIFQIDAWSLYPGYAEVRRIANAIVLAFREHDFSLMENALVTFEHWRTDYMRDGDVSHASVRFTAWIEQP